MLRRLWHSLRDATKRKTPDTYKQCQEANAVLKDISKDVALILDDLNRQAINVYIDKVCVDKASLERLIFNINDIGVKELNGSLSIGINSGGKVIRMMPDIKALEKHDSSLQRQPWPPLDITETANELIVLAGIPGLKGTNDVNVVLKGNILKLSGELKPLKEANFCHEEIPRGKFKREIRLPQDVSFKNIKTNYQQGILEIRISKKVLIT